MSLLQNTQALTLPNGVRIYCLPRQTAAVEIQVHIATGSINEGRFLGCGLSHFLEHMLFQGCKRYEGNTGAEMIHNSGGDCNAYTTFDHTAYYAEVPVEKFAEAADVICSMIVEPLFPAEKFVFS